MPAIYVFYCGGDVRSVREALLYSQMSKGALRWRATARMMQGHSPVAVRGGGARGAWVRGPSPGLAAGVIPCDQSGSR
jgi:hypothetical protein